MVTNAHEARRTAPLLASGVVLHVLPAGPAFDLTDARRWCADAAGVDPAEADELAVAGRDLRQLARDIAAGDVSPDDAAPALARRAERHGRDRQSHDDRDRRSTR